MKTYQIQLVYCNQLCDILNLQNPNFIRYSRNQTNRRLDTPLTNLKSEFLNYITLDGEHLTSIDLSNSQFTILAKLIQDTANELTAKQSDTANLCKFIGARESRVLKQVVSEGIKEANLKPDIKRFIQLTQKGMFYETFGQIALIEREQAKQAMFETLFSSHLNNTAYKKLLKEQFPNFVSLVDNFKKGMIEALRDKDKGNAALAVMLQKVESRIFIDNILSSLLKHGVKALSKHDSIIICSHSSMGMAKTYIIRQLDKHFGQNRYKLKVELHRELQTM